MPDVRITEKQRRAVAERAHGCCEYCRSQAGYATQRFSAEHILPRSRGGPTDLDNLAPACQGCNGHKHDKTEALDPQTQQIVPLFHPRRDRWLDHFSWDKGPSLIVGLTPTGRATVRALHLNRPSLANLRRVLRASGNHLPKNPGAEA